MKLTLDVTRCVVLTDQGEDKICLTFSAESPYPNMQYEATATIGAQFGYGATYCRSVLGVEPEIVNVGPTMPGKVRRMEK